MNKKLLILILILLILSGFAFYFFFYMKSDTGGVTGNIRNFLPFGKNTTVPSTAVPNDSISNDNNVPVDTDSGILSGTTSIPRLRLITKEATAGFLSFNKSRIEIVNGKKVTKIDTKIRYIERGTGNVFETQTDSLDTPRLTNTTYSKIQEAFFTNSGTTVIIRSLDNNDTIKTYVADIVAPSTTSTSSGAALGSLRGDYIDDNISFITVSPDTTRIFVLRQGALGANGFIADARAGKAKLVFSSKAGEWLPQWYGKDDVALVSKASVGIAGILFLNHTRTGTTERVVNGVTGLTALVNPSASRVLFSQSNVPNALNVFVLNKKTDSATPLSIFTLPEKCAWSTKQEAVVYCLGGTSIPSGSYPDSWYQGVVSFDDSIWKIDTVQGSISTLFKPSNIKASIDGIRPALTPDEKYLVFMNKKDGSLWSFQITE